MGLYLINRDGSGVQHLDLDPGFASDPYYARTANTTSQGPAWSPDGSKLMYYTLEPEPVRLPGLGFRIHIADCLATGAVTADRNLEFDRSRGRRVQRCLAARRGRIVFQTLEGIVHRLMVVAGAGSTPRDLGLKDTEGIGFILSPDGRQVISFDQDSAATTGWSQSTDLDTL